MEQDSLDGRAELELLQRLYEPGFVVAFGLQQPDLGKCIEELARSFAIVFIGHALPEHCDV